MYFRSFSAPRTCQPVHAETVRRNADKTQDNKFKKIKQKSVLLTPWRVLLFFQVNCQKQYKKFATHDNYYTCHCYSIPPNRVNKLFFLNAKNHSTDQRIDGFFEIIILPLIYSIYFVYVLYDFALIYEFVHPKSFELFKSILIRDKSIHRMYNNRCFVYSLHLF